MQHVTCRTLAIQRPCMRNAQQRAWYTARAQSGLAERPLPHVPHSGKEGAKSPSLESPSMLISALPCGGLSVPTHITTLSQSGELLPRNLRLPTHRPSYKSPYMEPHELTAGGVSCIRFEQQFWLTVTLFSKEFEKSWPATTRSHPRQRLWKSMTKGEGDQEEGEAKDVSPGEGWEKREKGQRERAKPLTPPTVCRSP